MLADICSTLPADPDHVDCNCFRLRVCCSPMFHGFNILQVTLIGVKLDAVRALVDIIYRGNCDLEQVLLGLQYCIILPSYVYHLSL